MEQTKFPNIAALVKLAPVFEALDAVVDLRPMPPVARVGSVVYLNRDGSLVAFYDEEVEYSESILAEMEALLVDMYTLDEQSLLSSIIGDVPKFDSIEIMTRQAKAAYGVLCRVGLSVYHYVGEEWIELFSTDSLPIERHFAAVLAKSYLADFGQMLANDMAELSEKIKVAPLYGSSAELAGIPAVEEAMARIGTEESYDVYRVIKGQWAVLSKAKVTMDEASVDDVALEARGVYASTAAIVAPTPGEYAAMTEAVDTSYPDMQPNGEQVSREVGARLHSDYLDMQKRVMLTKSFLIACGANAKDGHQLTQAWAEQAVIQKAGVIVRDIAADDEMQVAGFVAELNLPGLKAEMFDTNYHTLLIRTAHFIATRHDPDTDNYVNEHLRKFTASQIRQNETLQ